MTKSQAAKAVGGLSAPSKIPGKAYGIDPALCITGSKLKAIPGSVCEDCYAEKGAYVQYVYNVKPAWDRRLASMVNRFEWIQNMVQAIGADPVFRWHDAGDLQSVDHLSAIAKVCELTPGTKHWLPTREYKIVQDFIDAGGIVPDNLRIRLSGHMVDKPGPVKLAQKLGVSTSAVTKVYGREIPGYIGYMCPSSQQDNECKECRYCWESEGNVVYFKH